MIARPRVGANGLRIAALALLTTASLGCEANRSGDAPPSSSVARIPDAPAWRDVSPTMQFHGCEAIYADGRCRVADGVQLVLWVPDLRPEQLEVSLGGEPLSVDVLDVLEIAGGLRISLVPGVPESELELRVRDLDTHRQWSVRLSAASSAHRDTYSAAIAQARGGDFDGAIAALREQMPLLDADTRLQFEAGVSRIYLGSARHEQALRATADVFQSATELGRVDISNAAASRAVYIRTFLLPDYDDAQRWLEQIPPDPSAMSTAHYQRGLVAYRVADLRTAHREFQAALASSRPLGRSEYIGQALEMLAQVAAQLGRGELAEGYSSEALELALSQLDDHCWRASAWTNIGWARTLLAAEGVAHEDPRPALEHAIEGFTSEGCQLPRRAASARLNLAYAELIAGRTDQAKAQLSRLDRAGLTPWELSWIPLLEAELLVAEGHPKRALEGFARAGRLAQLGDDQELLWKATVGAAGAWTLLGKPTRALERYAAAEQMLERLAMRVGLDAGREMFLISRERVAGRHVELLLAAGNDTQALCVARRSLARPYRLLEWQRGLDASGLGSARAAERLDALAQYSELRRQLEQERADDWSLSPAEQRRVQRQRQPKIEALHELLDQAFVGAVDSPLGCAPSSSAPVGTSIHLLLIDAKRDRWVVFVEDSEGVSSATFERDDQANLDDRAWVQTILAPFEARLSARSDNHQRLTLELHTSAWALPFAAAQLAGQPLRDRFELAYGIGLSSTGGSSEPGHALIVADPQGNLSHARAEARTVARELSKRGWEVETLFGEAASVDALTAALERSSLLHYAGHARVAGPSGWDSSLPLAGGDELDVHDILALSRVPKFVVLSGCETGGSERREAGDVWNIAHAFLTAGAHTVVASTEIVPDREAGQMSAALYRNLDTHDGAASMARAQRELRAEGDSPVWDTFRVWIRPVNILPTPR